MPRRLIPRSLQNRLLLTYLILMLLGLGGLTLWTGLQLQTAVVEQAEHDLELEALIIANALREPLGKWHEGEEFRGRSLDILIRSYARSAGARVTVVDSQLQVLFSSDEAVPIHFEHDHPEIVAAQLGGEQHDIRWDEWRSEERLFVAAPIMNTEEAEEEEEEEEEGEGGAGIMSEAGVVQLSVPMAPLYAEMRRTWVSLLTAGTVVLLVTVLVSLVLARQMVGPIRNLTTVTEAMAAGNLNQKVTPAGPDEIERLGQAFNHMAEQVREMLARQQAFVANAAHELRSPLTSIRLRIEMLQHRTHDDPALAQRYLHQIEHEVEHLRRMVDHLLALSRSDAGRAAERSSLDLAPVLYELADEMGPLVQAGGLELQVEVPPHLPAVMANADPIRMVVRNLLDNAIKYTPAGGQVTLRATAGHRPTTTDNSQSSGPRPAAGDHLHRPQPPSVIIQVSDTGPGIPHEHLPHIFDRFYRVDKRRSRSQGGAGLGLSLVRSTVESHGGEVSVDSTPGQGSTFTVRLPAAE